VNKIATYCWTKNKNGTFTEWLYSKQTEFGWPGWYEQGKGEDGQVVTEQELFAKGPVYAEYPVQEELVRLREIEAAASAVERAAKDDEPYLSAGTRVALRQLRAALGES
jgi:hypothetical protein